MYHDDIFLYEISQSSSSSSSKTKYLLNQKIRDLIHHWHKLVHVLGLGDIAPGYSGENGSAQKAQYVI